jgi:hypothetical protein
LSIKEFAQQRRTLAVKLCVSFRDTLCITIGFSIPRIDYSELIGVLELQALRVGEFTDIDQSGLEDALKLQFDHDINIKLIKELDY